MTASAEKTLEWQDELVDENLIWRDSKIQKLAHLSKSEKLDILHSIAPSRSVNYKKTHQNNRRKYKVKLKKAIESQLSKGHVNIANLMSELLSYDDTALIPDTLLEKLKKLEMTRKKQRINMLQIYIKSHNILSQNVKNENSVYVQEGLFKIPHRWGIGTNVIDKECYITTVRDFLSYHFADYSIEAIICHHDERQLKEDTGAHSHYFLNGKNNQNGRYDLHKSQIRKVNEFIKSVGDIDDVLPENAQLNRQQSQVFGEYFQRMFYDFVNEKLLKPKGLVANFADETERKSQQRREMNRQSKLPKSQRSHNHYERQNELAKTELNETRVQQYQLEENISRIGQDTNTAEKSLASKQKELTQATWILRHYQKEITLKQDEVLSLKKEISGYKKMLSRLSDRVIGVIANICKKIYVRTALLNRGNEIRAKEYTNDILVNYEQLTSPEGRKIAQAAAKSLDDGDLFKAFDNSNELDDGKGFD